jgi:hypothetical protein
LIPLAYYLHNRQLTSSYVTSSADAADRERIRQWVTRSLLKRGIWGSGLDTLLLRLRDTIRDHGTKVFPAAEIEQAMAAVGKSVRFEPAEINELLDVKYGSPRVFPILATLYPGLDLTKAFHEDHIFPHSRFTLAKLLKEGVPPEQVDDYVAKADAIPNVQLLPGGPNQEKQATLPKDWLSGPHFTSDAQREQYVRENDLDTLIVKDPPEKVLPDGMLAFPKFFDARRKSLEGRLKRALGVE